MIQYGIKTVDSKNYLSHQVFIGSIDKAYSIGGGKVGNNCFFFGSSSIFVDDGSLQYISIGDNVNITRDVIILAHDFSYSVLEKTDDPVSLRPQMFTTI